MLFLYRFLLRIRLKQAIDLQLYEKHRRTHSHSKMCGLLLKSSGQNVLLQRKEDYEALVNELNEYKANYESLQNKYDEALNSLNKYAKKEKLESK